MQMHVNTKKIATAGICLALAMVLILAGSLVDVSSLSFMLLASFILGVVVNVCGLKIAAAYFAASVALSFFIMPVKLHVLTYGLMEAYILIREILWEKVISKKQIKRLTYMLIKFGIFNALFIPPVVLVSEFLFTPADTGFMRVCLILMAEVAFVIADMAYDVFVRYLLSRLKFLK